MRSTSPRAPHPRPASEAANRGKSLEKVILASQRDVVLTKLPQAALRIPGGKVVCVRGPVDFMGTYIDTGQALVFDAKVCDSPTRFPVGNPSHVPRHQVLEIIRHGKAGAVAGLFIESTVGSAFYWLSWRQLQSCPPSYVWQDLRWVGSNTMLPNWLTVRQAHQHAEVQQ